MVCSISQNECETYVDVYSYSNWKYQSCFILFIKADGGSLNDGLVDV